MTATEQQASVWSFQMQQPSAGWLSANKRLHWAAEARRVEVLGRLAYLRARQYRVPVLEAARIVCWFSWADKRRRDVDNLAPTCKAVVDGLVKAGLLPDDNDTHLLGPDRRRGPQLPTGTRSTLTVVVHPMTLEQVAAARTDQSAQVPR